MFLIFDNINPYFISNAAFIVLAVVSFFDTKHIFSFNFFY